MYTVSHLSTLPLGTKFRFYGDDAIYVLLSRNKLNVIVDCVDDHYPAANKAYVIPLFVSACLRVIKV